MGQPPEEKTEYSKMEPGVEQRNRKFIQSLITSRQRQHCSGVNNRAVLWVHVAATASIHFSDLQRLFAFLISLFSWEFRSPYRRHLAFSLLFSSLLFPSLLFFSLLFSSLLFSSLFFSFRHFAPLFLRVQKFTQTRVTIHLETCHKDFIRGSSRRRSLQKRTDSFSRENSRFRKSHSFKLALIRFDSIRFD